METKQIEVKAVAAAYLANANSAEPETATLVAAIALLGYLKAAVDPGAYTYFPHPLTEAERILASARNYLIAQT